MIDEPVHNDYTILMVAFVNLILLLLTEVLRSGLDRVARGKKIATTVLNVVYRERE